SPCWFLPLLRCPFWRRSKRKLLVPFYVAIAAAALGFLSNSRISGTDEVNALNREMAGATPENYHDKLAHSQTKLVRAWYSVIQVSERSEAKIDLLLSALDDQQLADVLAPKTLLDHEKRGQAKKLLKEKIDFSRTVSARVETLYDEMRKDMVVQLLD